MAGGGSRDGLGRAAARVQDLAIVTNAVEDCTERNGKPQRAPTRGGKWGGAGGEITASEDFRLLLQEAGKVPPCRTRP